MSTRQIGSCTIPSSSTARRTSRGWGQKQETMFAAVSNHDDQMFVLAIVRWLAVRFSRDISLLACLPCPAEHGNWIEMSLSGNLVLMRCSTTGRVCAWNDDVAMRDRYATPRPPGRPIR